jgi:hypothetical protein
MTPVDQFRYFRSWLCVAFVGLAIVALVNLMVDPIGAFPNLHIRSLEPYRPRVDNRTAKAELAHRSGWEIVTIGSSRVLSGLPADYPLFRSNRTVNLALTAPMLTELASALRVVRANNGKPPRMVILGIDFYMFAEGPDSVLDYMETRFNPKLDRVDYFAKRLIGLKATEDSVEVLRNHLRGRALELQDRDGFMKHRVGEDFAHRPVFEQVMRVFAPGYRAMPYDTSNRVEVLRKMLRDCREQNIDVRLMIMPIHALEMELLYACGKGESFAELKRTLVRLLAEEGLEGTVPLLDATGYAGPVAEEVPPAEVHGLKMKYFIENSHATPVLGEMLLNRLFGVGGTNQFGVLLTRTNIEDHLRQQRQDREAYLRAHPVDGQWPHRIVESLPPLKQRPATDGSARNP